MSDSHTHQTQRLTGEGSAKLILFGEHAVVYGKPAIVAGTGVGATATVSIGTEARLVVTDGVSGDVHSTVSPDDDGPLGRAFASILDTFDISGPLEGNVILHVPIGAGMGSSAALAVALARAIALFTRSSPEKIEDAVERSERIFHGSPSGIDQAAALRGGIFEFRREDEPVMEPFEVPAMELLVCQTSPGVATSEMVGRVARLHEQIPDVTESIDDAIAACVARARPALAAGDWEAVGRLMNVNHGLLAALGVSSEPLDDACHVARDAGAYGAKLTGAGGGGCVVALAESPADVIEAWRARGWTPFRFEVHTPET